MHFYKSWIQVSMWYINHAIYPKWTMKSFVLSTLFFCFFFFPKNCQLFRASLRNLDGYNKLRLENNRMYASLIVEGERSYNVADTP